MLNFKRIALGLALAFAAGAPGVAAAKDPVAPPVVRKAPESRLPPASARAPATRRSDASGPRACGTAGAPACTATAALPGSAENYYAALAAAAAASDLDPALDRGLMTAMSRLLAAGRCSDAVVLARRNGRSELAARAQQYCPKR